MIAPGQKLGRYQLREPLGSGGMSAVYRAYDPVLDREVAVKILPPEFARDAGFRERFHEEARTLGRVEHRNLVRIYAVGQEGPVSFYAMELIAGRSLRDALTALRRLSVPEALAVAGQVLHGLAAAHRAGIIHRDIKPGNIMIDATGRAVLMDFGLARRAERQSMTAHGAVLGTPEYMSPEQARGEAAERRSDLYSMGVLLYEMLAGRPPFGGKDTIAILRGHVEGAPPPLRTVAPEAPPAVEALVGRLLAKKPEERYPDTDAVLADVVALQSPGAKPERIIRELLARTVSVGTRATRTLEGSAPQPPPVPPTPPAPVDRFTRIRTSIAVMSAVVAVLALLVALVALLRERRPPELQAPTVPAKSAADAPPGRLPPGRPRGPLTHWTVTLIDGQTFEGELIGYQADPVGKGVWVFHVGGRGKQARRVPVVDGDIASMEQKGGENP